jgi:chromosome segregation ATPase
MFNKLLNNLFPKYEFKKCKDQLTNITIERDELLNRRKRAAERHIESLKNHYALQKEHKELTSKYTKTQTLLTESREINDILSTENKKMKNKIKELNYLLGLVELNTPEAADNEVNNCEVINGR